MDSIKALLISFLFFSCAKNGRLTDVGNSSDNFNVQFLFEKDGCNMYRFNDFDRVYFMTCPKSSTQYTKMCGKNCRKKIEQETK